MGDPRDDGPLVFVIAGEASGDALGARLMAGLRQRTAGRIRFAGIGGEAMTAEGLNSLVPMSELAVMGLLEVLPHARRILGRVRETAEAVKRLKPDVVITIDAPGFSFRVVKRLRQETFEAPMPVLIHYVAPTVWAWRPRRAAKIAKLYDKLLVLLPFEPPYFLKEGLDTVFVGHPIADSPLTRGDGAAFRKRHGIPVDATVLGVLPGSRRGEVGRLIPIFAQTVMRLAESFPNLHVVTPTVATVGDTVRAALQTWPVPTHVVAGEAEKAGAFASMTAALAASGTVGLELGAAGVPSVIAYRLNPLTYQIVKRLVMVKYVNLINILLSRPAVPELLQGDCTPNRLCASLLPLLHGGPPAAAQREAGAAALAMLSPPGGEPGLAAADAVLESLK